MENTRLKEDNKSQHKIIKLLSKSEEKNIKKTQNNYTEWKQNSEKGSHLSYNLFTVLINNRKTGYRFQ